MDLITSEFRNINIGLQTSQKPNISTNLEKINTILLKLKILRGAWWKRKFDSVYLGVLHKDDESLTNFLKNYGFENLDTKYPIHIAQDIPVLEIIVAFFMIVSCVNLLNSESKE